MSVEPTTARLITWGLNCQGQPGVPCGKRMPTELTSGISWWAVAYDDGGLKLMCAECFAKYGAGAGTTMRAEADANPDPGRLR